MRLSEIEIKQLFSRHARHLLKCPACGSNERGTRLNSAAWMHGHGISGWQQQPLTCNNHWHNEHDEPIFLDLAGFRAALSELPELDPLKIESTK